MVRVPCEPSVPSRKGHIAHVRSTDYFYNMIQYCIFVVFGKIGRVFNHDMALRSRYTWYTQYITLCSAISMVMRLKSVTMNMGISTVIGRVYAQQVPPNLAEPYQEDTHSVLLSALLVPTTMGACWTTGFPSVFSHPHHNGRGTGHENKKPGMRIRCCSDRGLTSLVAYASASQPVPLPPQ